MKRILSGWNFMRVLRLALGIFIVVQGIVVKDWTFTALGSIFLLMPLLNIGCCSTSGCKLPVSGSQQNLNSPKE